MGRNSTVVITTSMMAISCIIMANLPTYSQIGIAASWFITICRVIQGISSVGESVKIKHKNIEDFYNVINNSIFDLYLKKLLVHFYARNYS